MVETIGTIGALIICGSAIPQVVKTFRTKRAGDLSMTYLLVLMTGMILLQIYSLYIRDIVYIFGNTLSMATTGSLILLSLKYKRKQRLQEVTNHDRKD